MPKVTDNITQYITVSDVNGLINHALADHVGELFFQGEISELKRATSGHMYFTVKDDKSQISAVMWKGMTAALKFIPRAGLQVLCHGKPGVYNVTGKLQITVHYMAEAGEGLLQKKFLELKEKLQNEGIFSEARKRPIPFLPKAVGIITSPTGAVIHDIMVKINERMPSQLTYLIGVRVQGEGASQEIANAIKYFNSKKIVDVIILARGGGSLEDLWAFNEEKTVRAVFGSEIPVVCGVGHEVDITLADLAADLRAPTPTAAAEFVVPKRNDLLNILSDYEKRMQNFSRWLMPLMQRVDELNFKLNSSLTILLQRNRMRLQSLQAKVDSIQPVKYLQILNAKIGNLSSLLLRHTTKVTYHAQSRLETLTAKLNSMSPLKVLERGYSITEKIINGKAAEVVKNSTEVAVGDELKIILHKGTISAKVSNQ